MRAAIGARTAGSAEPGDANPPREAGGIDTRTDGIDTADDLVSGNERQLRVVKIAVDNMKVGAAHRAGFDRDAHFARAGFAVRTFAHDKGLAHLFKHHRSHRPGFLRFIRNG